MLCRAVLCHATWVAALWLTLAVMHSTAQHGAAGTTSCKHPSHTCETVVLVRDGPSISICIVAGELVVAEDVDPAIQSPSASIHGPG